MPPPRQTGEVHPRTVQVRSSCWSCGTAVTRDVQRRHRHHRHLQWACAGCQTSWLGPGEAD